MFLLPMLDQHGEDQHSTGHNQQPDRFYVLYCVRQMVKTPDNNLFSDPLDPHTSPHYSKTAHFRVARPHAHLHL